MPAIIIIWYRYQASKLRHEINFIWLILYRLYTQCIICMPQSDEPCGIYQACLILRYREGKRHENEIFQERLPSLARRLFAGSTSFMLYQITPSIYNHLASMPLRPRPRSEATSICHLVHPIWKAWAWRVIVSIDFSAGCILCRLNGHSFILAASYST